MTFNVLLTGVGGEGVLITSTILARAANFEGYHVAGVQLHGLAQRGGAIPTHVRFGNEGEKVYSPTIPRGEADLILGLETMEAVREVYFADKERTNFLIDTYTIIPVYTHLYNEKYPTEEEIKKMIKPFGKSVTMVNAGRICEEKLGSAIYSNVMMLGIALSKKLLPISKESMLKSIKQTIPRGIEQNMKAFEMGLKFKK